MSTYQEQYEELAKRGQDAAFAAVDAWTKTVQSLATQLPTVTTRAAAQHVVDQYFDYAGTVLDIQRSLAKQVVASSAAAAQDVADRATKAANEAGATVAQVSGRARKSAAAS